MNPFLYLLIFILIIFIIIAYYHAWDMYRNQICDVADLAILDRDYCLKPRVQSKYPVVISLTTIPLRINDLRPTLASLLRQSQRVDTIRINVPLISKKGEYNIPDWLLKLKSVSIVRCETDYGPSTKLLPTLLDCTPETRIIVVDDDIIYGYYLVENLITEFEKRSGKEAVTAMGRRLSEGKKEKFKRFASGYCHCDALHGFGGYIIIPQMFITKNKKTKNKNKIPFGKQSKLKLPQEVFGPGSVFDYSVGPPEAFYVDDDWISGHLRKNGVPIYMLGIKYRMIVTANWNITFLDSLSDGSNKDMQNARKVNDYFASLGYGGGKYS